VGHLDKNAALKKNPSWDITAYHDAEMDLVKKNLFDHSEGRCSYIFSNEELEKYAKELDADVTQKDIRAEFNVGTEWGMDVDNQTGEVLGVIDDSPAHKQNIREGDFIVGIDDEELTTNRQLQWLFHVMYEYSSFEQFPFNGVVNLRRVVWGPLEKNLLSQLRE